MNDIKKMAKYIKPYKTRIILVSIFSIIYSVLCIISPKILSLAINRLVEKIGLSINNTDYKFIINILIICVIIYIFTNLVKYFNSVTINKICNKISYNLRKDISLKMNKLKLSYFNDNDYGEVISRVSEDVDNISNNLEQILSELISAIICFIGVLIMMLSISKMMTIVTILLIPIQMILMVIIMFKSQKYFNQKKDVISKIDSKILSSVTSHKLIKLNNTQKKEINEFNKINDDLYNCCFKSDFLSSIILPLVSLINNISYIIISIFGGISVIKGNLKIGDIQAFLQYIQIFNDNSETLGGLSGTFQNVYASIKHINLFLELDEEIDNGDLVIDKLRGKIEFKNVNFSYDGKHKVINNFNAVINPGDTIAIVGHTGCGKTTLINLLMKFYDNYKGEILIDNIEISKIKTNSLRDRLGIVLQDSFVYNDTVLNNIKFGNNLDDKDLNIMNKKFNLNSYLNYDLIIDEDKSNVSSGEEQLISIFRTLINDFDIVILDEATSNIDSRTEVLIQDLTRKIMKNKTSIIIAHRLSTIKDAKCIFVMDNGKLVEAGTHNDLLKINGKYKKMYENSI